MAYSTKLFILFLIFVATLFGYNYLVKPFAENNEVTKLNVSEPETHLDERSFEVRLLDSLSPEQRVAQVLTIPLDLINNSATESASFEWINQYKPGFVLVFGQEISTQSAELLNYELKQVSKDESLEIAIAVDHEGGTVQRYNGEGFTQLPSWQSLCATEELSERTRLLTQSAIELKKAGVDVVFAPVFDTKTPSSFLGSRTCSTDQAIISSRSKEFIEVMKSQSVLSVLKHFPNIGTVDTDLHFGYDTVSINTDDLLAFKDIVNQFPKLGVMTTHVGVTNQDPLKPCSLSVDCVGELKNNYKEVLIFTDALEMRSAQGKVSTSSANLKSTADIVYESLLAGNHVAVLGDSSRLSDFDLIFNKLLTEYNRDENFKNIIDENVKMIIKYKREFQP